MNMEQGAIVVRVKEFIIPLLASRHVQLVELTYRQEGGRGVLRCLVDTAGGIQLGELSALNQAIGAVLEEHELIPSAYFLEVSSPGLDRSLKTMADFEWVIGRRIRISTTVPVNSKRELSGDLLGVTEEAVFIKVDSGEKVKILLSEIARAVQEIKI